MARTTAPAATFALGNSSLSSMQRDVLNYIQATQDDTDLNALATSYINKAIDRLNRRNWIKTSNKTLITLVSGQAEYVLPDDYRNPIVLLRLNSSGNRDGRVEFKELKTLLLEHPSATASAEPTRYSIQYQQRKLELYPAPSSSHVSAYPTYQHWYYRRLPQLANDTDTVGAPPEFEEFITNHAAMLLAASRGHQVFPVVRELAAIGWQELVNDDNETQTDWSDV